MAELNPSSDLPARGPLFYIGAGGLLLAMIVETIAVLGRHVGIPLVGALEIMQACILLMASTAMLSATLNKGHAAVTILTHRVNEATRRALHVFAQLLSAAFFVALAIGAAWLAMEAWNEHEQSEMLHIPFKPLRIISLLAAGSIAFVFLRDMVRGSRNKP